MGKIPKSFIRHEVPRRDSQGLTSIYCRRCGREIIRCAGSPVRSVTACQICIMKEQGIEHPEEHVLTAYALSADHNRLPMPLEDEGYVDGILALYPEEQYEQTGILPQSGGVVGTVRSVFRAFGFFKPKEEVIAEEPISKAVAKGKRGKGLFAPKKER